jgi:hypothetical protein
MLNVIQEVDKPQGMTVISAKHNFTVDALEVWWAMHHANQLI